MHEHRHISQSLSCVDCSGFIWYYVPIVLYFFGQKKRCEINLIFLNDVHEIKHTSQNIAWKYYSGSLLHYRPMVLFLEKVHQGLEDGNCVCTHTDTTLVCIGCSDFSLTSLNHSCKEKLNMGNFSKKILCQFYDIIDMWGHYEIFFKRGF